MDHLAEVTGTPHDDDVLISIGLFDLLSSPTQDTAVSQPELSNHGRQEGSPPLARLDQGDRELRANDLQRNSWYSRSGPEIRNRDRSRRKQSKEQEAIQDDVLDEPAGLDRSDETLRLLPPGEEREIRLD
jgi:hypothetical protein